MNVLGHFQIFSATLMAISGQYMHLSSNVKKCQELPDSFCSAIVRHVVMQGNAQAFPVNVGGKASATFRRSSGICLPSGSLFGNS